VNPLGSCPANTSGPIADGSQLVDQVQNPGNGGSAPQAPAPAPPASTSTVDDSTTAAPATSTAQAPPTQTSAGGGNGGFALANGQAAQELNAKFATLAEGSACTAGEIACVGNAFAQCVDGNFVTIQCGGGLICAALPLVNSRGTSVTCTTTADAEDRIARTGATGGLTGSGATNGGNGGQDIPEPESSATVATILPSETASVSTVAAPTATSAPSTGAGGFKLANGQTAQSLNKKFEGLTADSACRGEFYSVSSSVSSIH
jgi:hypothetical protein